MEGPTTAAWARREEGGGKKREDSAYHLPLWTLGDDLLAQLLKT